MPTILTINLILLLIYSSW